MLKTKHTVFQAVLVFVVLLYIFLCAVHLILQRPLWNDEECVFRSVQSYSPQQMFGQDLMALQVFPRVYLFLIQQFAKVFDFSLWSLRLPSFLCMIAAFLVWLRLARYGLQDRWQYLAFVCSWPASGMMLYYSAELKQYSMDVLAVALFLLFLYNQERLQKMKVRRYTVFLAMLPVLGLFSYPAFIAALLPLYNLVIASFRDRSVKKDLCVYAVSLAVVACLSYFYDMRWRPEGELAQGFGDYFISFASAGEFFRTFGEGVNNLFSRWFIEYPKFFKSVARIFVGWGLIYMFYGFFAQRKKEGGTIRSLETAALVLFVLMFLLGCLHKYPFTVPRTSLFFAPIVLYMTAKGIGLAAKVHPYLYRVAMNLYFVFLGFLLVMQPVITFHESLSYYPRLW